MSAPRFQKVRPKRAVMRPGWRAFAPGRPMRWWVAFSQEVKRRRIPHRDRARLAALVPLIDARVGTWTVKKTTTTGDE